MFSQAENMIHQTEAVIQQTAAIPGVLLAGTRNLAAELPKRIFDIDFDLSDSRDELKKKIAWIIRIRYVVNPSVVLLMFITNWQGLTRGANALSRETLFSTILVSLCSIALNTVYFLAMKKPRINLRQFVLGQLVLDVLTFSAYVWRTGGVTSPFTFLYFLPILGSSILLSAGTGMAMAGIISSIYLLIVVLESTGFIPHISYFVALDQFAQRGSYISLMTLVNLFAFAVVAGVSGFLMRSVQQKARELAASNLLHQRKAKLFGMLYQISEVLQYHKTLDEVLDRICDVLVTEMNVDRALMYVKEKDELKLRRLAYHQRVPAARQTPMQVSLPLDPKGGLTSRCALENRSVNVTEPTRHEGINRELAEKIGLNPFALAPMTYRDQVFGVLGIDRGGENAAITDEEFEVLKIFALQAGQTLAAALQPADPSAD